MIPKIIHYCWFGHNPLPPLAIKCIDSWRKYLPDYEIKEWNESNFDVNIIAYTAEAYQARKYAFVSDYARFWILYHEGGLYFDTDVELIKPIDDIISRGPFMGCERDSHTGTNHLGVNPGLGIGCEAGNAFYGEMLDHYSKLSFKNADGTLNLKNIVDNTTEVFWRKGLRDITDIHEVAGIFIYPCEYFCPIHSVTKKLRITKNTRSIHHYNASWVDMTWKLRMKQILRRILPDKLLLFYNRRKHASDLPYGSE